MFKLKYLDISALLYHQPMIFKDQIFFLFCFSLKKTPTFKSWGLEISWQGRRVFSLASQMIQPILNHLSNGKKELSLIEPSCMPSPSPNTHTPPVREALTVLLLPLEGLKLGSIPLPGEDFWCTVNVPFLNCTLFGVLLMYPFLISSPTPQEFINLEQFVEQNSYFPEWPG